MDKNNNLFLEIAKNIAREVGQKVRIEGHLHRGFSYDDSNIKEMKTELDLLAEKIIIDELKLTKLSILSEEEGMIKGDPLDSRCWIVDPIDGTFNYIKNLGPCTVSIGLWDQSTPIFGVIFSVNTEELFWGGKEFGAFCNEQVISVSDIDDISLSSICTGFPVRFDMESEENATAFWTSINKFSKVRMIGCASMSLVYVARGSAEVYMENQIMIWDVAAGVAIVEGAGGVVSFTSGVVANALRVKVSNNRLSHDPDF